MVEENVQGADYRSYYHNACTSDYHAAAAQKSRTLEELADMMSMSIRVTEFCFHCLDSSPWPFLLDEILENYALAVEAPHDFSWKRAAGRLMSASTRPGPVSPDAAVPPLDEPSDVSALGALPIHRLILLRLQVRWIRGLESEARFWRKKLSFDPEENNSLERLRKWLQNGEVIWYYDDLCMWVEDTLRRSKEYTVVSNGKDMARGPPRILNVGSGPFAPRPLQCKFDSDAASALPQGKTEWPVPVIAADGLARFYLRIFDEHGLVPLYTPIQCPVEEIHTCFPPRHFDVAHMRNSLDHAFDPLLGIERMLSVVRPGGWVLLRHARNEGVPGKFRNGLHQWAFDGRALKDEEVLPGMSGGWAFLIWNPDLELDVSDHLLRTGLAAEVRTELKDHPSPDAPPDEKYVWVDIRKPTETEVAVRRQAMSEVALNEALEKHGAVSEHV